MARRKKNRKKLNGFVFPTPVASLIIASAIVGVAYLWLSSTAEVLGGQIRDQESVRRGLHEQFQNEQYRWTRLKSPRSIEAALATYGIVMVWPQRDQVVRMSDLAVADFEPPGRDTLSLAPRQYVHRGRTVRHE